MTREWARWMYEQDMLYQIYAALRDSVNQWDLVQPELFEGGWYGRDFPDGWDGV